VNFFYGKRKPIYSEFETYAGDLNQVKYERSKNEYQMALILVNEVLKKAPNLPQALYLKAQILWEDYHKAADAKNLLEKIIKILPDKMNTYHIWAKTMLDQINSVNPSK
jgi:tetratricopeptide (TPR) repeat protein